jgi:hypothetical protein
MKNWQVYVIVALVAALTPLACSKTPGAPSVSFTSPIASGPANGTVYKYAAQPLTLSITNATRTGSASPTYSLEVASDSNFSNKVFTKDGIAEGSGSTAVQLGTLAGGTTYYWRSRAVIEGVAGPFSSAQTFTVQPQIIISAPGLNNPASGATVSEARPTFVVSNASRVGPVGTIFYEFQVSTSSNFSSLAASQTVQETGGSGGNTSWTVGTDLPAGNYFWRARATDPSNTEASSFAAGTSFTLQPFDMRKAIIHNNPANLGSWEETSKITMIDMTGQYILVDFDKREGPGRWPSVAFGSGSIQYTLGMCFNFGGTWHCSAVIQFWEGRELEAGGDVNEVGINWYYDGRWVPMSGHQPARGEMVGVFAAAGNIRDSDNWAREQRTNVVILPFGSKYVAK